MLTKKIVLLIVILSLGFNLKAQYKDTITVARDGTGDYRNIQEAIENVRAYMDHTVTIYIKKSTYKEKVVIPSWIKNVVIIGEDVENTILTYDDHANIDNMGTFRTYTLKIEGNNITIKNLTIENNAPQMGQAVALHTVGDKLLFIGCRLLGNQDTVFTGGENTRLYFYDCYIEGTTDFIFGPATAMFEKCQIHSKRDSYITAASTPENVPFGYVFNECKLTAEPNVKKVHLGRPWRPYGYTLFMNSELGSHILPVGWHNWNKPENEETARYLEYNNYGEGAATDQRVGWSRQLTDKDVKGLTKETVFSSVETDNWLPEIF